MLISSGDLTWDSWFAFADIAAAPIGRSTADSDLVHAVLRKDRKATAEFVQLFSGRVYSYIRSRLAPRTELTEDLVNETFIAAWQHLTDYRGEYPLEAWLIGIARHKVEDHYRRQLSGAKVWEGYGPEGDATPLTPITLDQDIDRRTMASRAEAILAGLPGHYAAILSWRYWEGKSSREIGAAIGKTEKAVERLLARAREQFKRSWLDER
ncbi:MAG: sigma-70 family RNA polymerase sigma factor [Bryobacteraceae bacterium]|nr:sigma-70 family RNA polymerase sigma factor [Bryobacteraceae bacterium]